MKILKQALLALLVLATLAVYVLRSFHPEQPLHHEFNAAGGVLIVATILCWWLFPDGDDS